MAFNLSTPTAALAFEMALRNQRAIDSSAGTDAQARSAVSKALAPGNDQLAPFDDIYRQYMDPAEEARRAQAQAFNAYLIGLPELLAKAAKEGRSTGGGGAGAAGGMANAGNSNYITPEERLESMLNSLGTTKLEQELLDDAARRRSAVQGGMGSGRRTTSRTPVMSRTTRSAITPSGMGSGGPRFEILRK